MVSPKPVLAKSRIPLLDEMQAKAGPRMTHGLPASVLGDFEATDERLGRAIEEAHAEQKCLFAEFPELKSLPEKELIKRLQAGFVNFYPEDQTNPYVPLAARGPWIVTSCGAVLHDSGGYGMIGFGHGPDFVLQAMARPHVMANIMTASFSQHRLVDRLRKEIGHARAGKVCPFARFICVNSGSESMTVALRISDINAKKQLDAGQRHAGKRTMFLTLKGGFHGRTERPAQASNSSAKNYKATLNTFRDLENNYTVEPNDVKGLEAAFAWADQNKVFFEAMLVEPVMGEGDPGKAMTRTFYDTARRLTKAMGTMLVVDSIQAGLRAQGTLSIVDYPDFKDAEAPDMETYSKALNAGQFPLSVLALGETAANTYVRGVYGNTKTTNPRALDVAVAVLDALTPELRKNIVERGKELLDKFAGLKKEFPEAITKVQGTGLLVSIEVDPSVFKIVGFGELEEYLRIHGIGVIHGGANALRFTPHFGITSKEVDMLIGMLRKGFKEGPRKSK